MECVSSLSVKDSSIPLETIGNIVWERPSLKVQMGIGLLPWACSSDHGWLATASLDHCTLGKVNITLRP